MKTKYSLRKKILLALVAGFILINALAAAHAYKFTHFSNGGEKTKGAEKLSTLEKLKTVILGINHPRPVNTATPSQPYDVVYIQSNVKLQCWHIHNDSSRGTVLLFHGYSSNKSALVNRSDAFVDMGYDILLVDFMGSGGSEGNETTIGYKEAQNVYDCYKYISEKDGRPIYLFGNSMGSAAILKSIYDYHFDPAGIVIECPFGSMYKTTCARFREMHVPSFPMAGFLMFWGGAECGFWPFGHNPQEYAASVGCPTLLMAGGQDDKVSKDEIDLIYAHLKGPKTLVTYPTAKHEDYFKQYRVDWLRDVASFMR